MNDTRRPDIDWLRVGATYLLFVFHTGMVFNPAPFYHVRNAELSFVMLVVCGFVSLWHMPLFFVLAGWSAAAALRVREAGGFAVERVRRLVVPLVAGCVLLAPAIKYVELENGLDLYHRGLRVAAVHQAGFQTVIPGGLPLAPPFGESFATFLPTFFSRLDRFTWSHLWFVAYLFTLSMACLPAFVWLHRRRDRLVSPGPWIVYLPLIGLVAIQLTLRERWPGIYNLYDDWANVAYYTTFLLSGFVLACQPALERLVDREWPRALAVGGGVTGVLLLAVLGFVTTPAVLLVGPAVAAWCFVVALLGIARRFFTASSPALSYLSESAFPVYVLHQAAIVIPGHFVVRLDASVATKFVLLLVLAVAVTMATYQWLVRPFAVPRFLLGMRPARTARRLSVASRPAAMLLLGPALLVAISARVAASPLGLWYAEGGAAQVEIAACGDALCGRVVWLRSPFDEDGCHLRDRYNPDPTLRDRSVMGLEVLRGLVRQPDGTWASGRIYDPGSGRTYACELSAVEDDRLRLRGYLGVPLLGRTTTWLRVGRETRVCHEHGAP